MAKAVLDVEDEPKLDADDPFRHLKNKRLPAVEFWRVMEAIPSAAWGRYKIYGYRLWPRIDRKLSNPSNPTNIFALESAVDEQWLLQHHGSGKYDLKLNDQTRPDKFRLMCMTNVEVQSDEFPPVLDLRELDMGYDGNRSYIEGLRARGLLKDNNGRADPDRTALNDYIEHLKGEIRDKKTDSPEANAINKAIGIMSQAYTEGLKTLDRSDDPDKFAKFVGAMKELQSSQSPAGSLKEAVESIKGIVEMTQPKGQPNVLETVKEIVKLTQPQAQPNGVSSFKEMASAFKDIAAVVRPETPKASAVDPLLTTLMQRTLEKALGDEGGGGSGLGGKWDFWGEVIRQGAPALRDIVHDAINAWQLAKLGRAWTPTGAQPGVPRGGPTSAGPAFAAALPGPAPTPRGEPSSPQPAVPAPQPAASGQPAPDPRMQVLAQVAPGFLNHLTGGSSGDAFAQWVETGYGALAYDQLASFGVEGLLDVLKTSPAWPQLAPLEGRVREFLTDFIDYGKDDDGEPGDGPFNPPDAPAAVEVGKGKGGKK